MGKSSTSDSGSSSIGAAGSGAGGVVTSRKWSTWRFHCSPDSTSTTKDTGQVWLMMIPGIHLGPVGRRLRTITFWPTSNLRSLACWL